MRNLVWMLSLVMMCDGQNVNECGNSTQKFHSDAACANTIGRYSGCSGSDCRCTDVDQRESKTHHHHTDVVCASNFVLCTCAGKKGFTGDGVVCQDVDEYGQDALMGIDAVAAAIAVLLWWFCRHFFKRNALVQRKNYLDQNPHWTLGGQNVSLKLQCMRQCLSGYTWRFN